MMLPRLARIEIWLATAAGDKGGLPFWLGTEEESKLKVELTITMSGTLLLLTTRGIARKATLAFKRIVDC